jgi:L-ascorbate metabolism protein UlaG (beta-lactamase superfamily)
MNLESFIKEKIVWLGHASFRIDGEKATVYIDPWKLKNPKPADLVCITHSHFDHLSIEDIALIRKPSTVIIGPADCKANFGASFREIRPGQSINVGDINVEAYPAYNIDKDFHPQKNGWVGYVVEIDGVRIYHSGDTDKIPEMAEVRANVALLPVGGTYTMTVKQAGEAASMINTDYVVPMHCGDIVGTFENRNEFGSISKKPVIILDPTAGV